MRAGLLSVGEDATKKAVVRGTAAFVLLDAGASRNARKMIRDTCEFYGVPWYELREGELGRRTGKPNRMSAAVQKGKLSDLLLSYLPNEAAHAGNAEPPS